MFYFKKEPKLVKKCRLAFKTKLILEVSILLSIFIQPIQIPSRLADGVLSHSTISRDKVKKGMISIRQLLLKTEKKKSY